MKLDEKFRVPFIKCFLILAKVCEHHGKFKRAVWAYERADSLVSDAPAEVDAAIDWLDGRWK